MAAAVRWSPDRMNSAPRSAIIMMGVAVLALVTTGIRVAALHQAIHRSGWMVGSLACRKVGG